MSASHPTLDEWLASVGMSAEFSKAEGAVYVMRGSEQMMRIARDDLNELKDHGERIRFIRETLKI